MTSTSTLGRPSRRAAVAAMALIVAAAPLHAQSSPQSSPQSTPQPPAAAAAPAAAARPADVATPEALIAALYDVISGPAGQPRDWARLRALFAPAGRMLPVVPRPDGSFAAIVMTPDEFVRQSSDVITRFGFTERELARRMERFGNVVHAWSTYEGRFTAPGAPTAEPIRGINSIQLTSDGARWYVSSLTWEAERPGLQIPATYLRSAP